MFCPASNAGAHQRGDRHGVDDDGNPDEDTDDETVPFDDVLPEMNTTRRRTRRVPETGGDVTFTIVVDNNSLVDNESTR